MTIWAPADMAKYRWFPADDEVLAAIEKVEAMNRESIAALKDLGDRYGATNICFRGDRVAGLALENPTEDWREVHRERGVRFYLPYRRRKAMKEACDEITATKRVSMNAFANLFGGLQFVGDFNNGAAFYSRGPVFLQIGDRTFFGLPIGVNPELFTKNPDPGTEVPLSEVIAAAEKEATA